MGYFDTKSQSQEMKILAVHSLPVNGMAGLKPAQIILGSALLPQPSVILTGLTNMEGFVRKSFSLEEFLEPAIRLALKQNEELVLYVGYLSDAQQADLITGLIRTYREDLTAVLVDPVSGDNGQPYVPEAVVRSWPALLEVADWAFPNLTELGLVTDTATTEVGQLLESFALRYPGLNFICTGLVDEAEGTIGLYMNTRGQIFHHNHEWIPVQFGGTGDVFVSHFIREHFLRGQPAPTAMRLAAEHSHRVVKSSVDRDSTDLILP